MILGSWFINLIAHPSKFEQSKTKSDDFFFFFFDLIYFVNISNNIQLNLALFNIYLTCHKIDFEFTINLNDTYLALN